MKERRRNRINSKITQLPEHVRDTVNSMLLDTSNTYTDISDWLKGEGYDISRSAVGRYAMHSNEASRRVTESIARTNAIVSALEKNPDLDYTRAARLVLADGLMQRVSTAEEEFQEMPLDKAGNLVASLARVGVYEQRVKHEIKNKIELAFKGLEDDLIRAINADPQLVAELRGILTRAREKVLSDE